MLQEANPPPEVLRAAQREFKRLQRGSEQHPGAPFACSARSAQPCQASALPSARAPVCLHLGIKPACAGPPRPLGAGYSMSLSYLETLADLPWSRLSTQPSPPQHQAATTTAAADKDGEDEEHDEEAARHAQRRAEQSQQADAPAGATPLPLAAVRQRLDDAHYGLEKIKERIVQYVAVQRLR